VQVVAFDPEPIAEIAVDALKIAARRVRAVEDLVVDDRDVEGSALPARALSSAWLFSGPIR
jgi:hypothetical protein